MRLFLSCLWLHLPVWSMPTVLLDVNDTLCVLTVFKHSHCSVLSQLFTSTYCFFFFFLNVILFKGALCCFLGGRHVNQKRFQPEQTKKANFLYVNHLTLKDNSLPYWFIWFICGGPCHLPSFRQCSGDISCLLRTACLLSYCGKNIFI